MKTTGGMSPRAADVRQVSRRDDRCRLDRGAAAARSPTRKRSLEQRLARIRGWLLRCPILLIKLAESSMRISAMR